MTQEFGARDLRDWLARAEEIGQLETIRGAHWDNELGAIGELLGPTTPALLFDEITDYPAGYRVLTNPLRSPQLIAMTLNLEPTGDRRKLVSMIREHLRHVKAIEPEVVKTGPIFENVHTGSDINLWEFPVPKFHEGDGGRFIGTGCLTVTRDPDSGWVNCGAYRVMVQDERRANVYITVGKHGRQAMDKYWAQGKACPIAVVCGQDPLLFMLSGHEVPYGVSEYAYAGGLRGEPVKVVHTPVHGLPVPADAEIVLEGEVPPGVELPEGPFGEWTGYYATQESPKPVINIQTVMHRNSPILLGSSPGKVPSDSTYYRSPFKAAALWDQLEAGGLPGVTGVYCPEVGGARMIIVVGIRQMYPGHPKQAGHMAMSTGQGAHNSKLIVVVDDDIDPTNMDEVLWAICTRSDYRMGVEIVHRCWTSVNDPIQYDGGGHGSRLVIDACRPWERLKSFPVPCRVSDELEGQIRSRWQDLFARHGR